MKATSEKMLIEGACWRNIGVWGSTKPRCPSLAKVIHCKNCEVFAQAAKQVFMKQSSEQELFERSLDLYHNSDFEDHTREVSLLPFRVGPTWFCVSPQDVINVAQRSHVHKLPNRKSEVVKGLVAVEGQIYTCISLSYLMHIPRIESKSNLAMFKRILILKVENKQLAIRVDEVRNISFVNNSEILAISPECPENVQPYVRSQLIFDQFLNEQMYCLDLEVIGQDYLKALV